MVARAVANAEGEADFLPRPKPKPASSRWCCRLKSAGRVKVMVLVLVINFQPAVLIKRAADGVKDGIVNRRGQERLASARALFYPCRFLDSGAL